MARPGRFKDFGAGMLRLSRDRRNRLPPGQALYGLRVIRPQRRLQFPRGRLLADVTVIGASSEWPVFRPKVTPGLPNDCLSADLLVGRGFRDSYRWFFSARPLPVGGRLIPGQHSRIVIFISCS